MSDGPDTPITSPGKCPGSVDHFLSSSVAFPGYHGCALPGCLLSPPGWEKPDSQAGLQSGRGRSLKRKQGQACTQEASSGLRRIRLSAHPEDDDRKSPGPGSLLFPLHSRELSVLCLPVRGANVLPYDVLYGQFLAARPSSFRVRETLLVQLLVAACVPGSQVTYLASWHIRVRRSDPTCGRRRTALRAGLAAPGAAACGEQTQRSEVLAALAASDTERHRLHFSTVPPCPVEPEAPFLGLGEWHAPRKLPEPGVREPGSGRHRLCLAPAKWRGVGCFFSAQRSVFSLVMVTVVMVVAVVWLAGQGVAVLPQVRPKTLIPDSLPITPGRDRPPKQPPTFQKATVVSIKNPSPALPTANNTVSHVPAPGSQPQALAEPAAITSSLSSAGVAYAIISTAPSNAAALAPSAAVSVVSDSIKVQPLLISTDNKVIIIQPQVQTQPESKAESRPPTEEPSQGAQAAKRKEDRPPSQENPEKIAFMVALGLVTTEHLEARPASAQRHPVCRVLRETALGWVMAHGALSRERKRRSTANPAYSGLLETERKRLASSYLNSPLFLTARANEDPCWKSEIAHDEHCAACQRGADLQPCGTCPGAYHLGCLDPPLKTAPKGVWVCPKCQQKALKKDEAVPWTGMLAIVRSYVTHKTVKEEEKQKLLQRGSQLQSEHRQLEERDRRLASAVKKCLELKMSLLARQRGTQSSLDRLRALLRLIQGEQMLQVTMTTTSPASLLAGPWTKPSAAAMHAALQHPQGHN
ncbi:PREDICTED: PHD finger protein 21B [Myotis davidii]|uniref:PHD finger protein 21B n=1 Tax=Myotis davidii TaxID=225400 RepID=UPI00076786C2|nr:PREDICTED: PHD finger protein 21B [Myotis davidii]